MKNRQLWFLNVVLAGAALLLVARIGGDWKRGNERYSRLTQRSAAIATPLVPPDSSAPQPAAWEVVSRNLFTPDRNNDRPQEAPLQTAAALPIVIGTMRLGAEYEALMSEAGQPGTERFRRLKLGDRVGAYTVVEIRDEAVVVEFQGQKTVVNVYQSARSVIRAAASPAATAAKPPAAPVIETASPTPAPAASSVPAATPPAANAGTSLTPPFPGVRVTIEGNRKRFERDTAFGPQVWYEDIK